MRRPLPVLLACAAALASTCCSSPKAPEELVLLVVVDTLRHDALGCYGGPRDASPRIDALAAEGVLFEQAIATSGWTLPSVASLLTGAWPVVHKARGQKTLLTPISPDVPTAAELLTEAGFHTTAVVNAAFLSPLLGIDRGFERFDHRHAFNRDIRRADRTVRDALALIDKRHATRRFLFVHLFDPHLDYDPPGAREGAALSRRRCLELGEAAVDTVRERYQEEVRAVDAAVGELVDGLRQRGLWDRTTLVLCADHGEEFWEHGGFEHGHSLFEELIHVPLIIRPRTSTAAVPRSIARPVSLVDVMPTIFEWEDIETPDTFLGRSLAGLIEGEPADDPRPIFSQGRLYGSDLLSWRTDRYHYLFDRGAQAQGANSLFDWRADPTEQRDLADSRPALVSELHGELARFWGDLQHRSRLLSVPDVQDMSPTRVRELTESLDSLGYTDGARGR
ncbi:MAG TPA: sulfatase [Planctomycetota bacterium]|nr:sulfatase [Planctomycetota bacterium]